MKAVIFDMDGVIFDSERTNLDCWNIIADKYGFERPEIIYKKTIGVKAETAKLMYLEYYGEDFPYDKYAEEKSILFHSEYDGGNLPIKQGVKELLEYFKSNGYHLSLASSTRVCIVEQQIKDAGFYDCFDRIIGGDMIEKSKPAPDIFLKAVEGLEITPEDVYVIEDSYNGIRAAFNAGMMPIMVPDMLSPTDEMKEKSKLIFNNLNEVKEYFESKN